MTRARTIYDPEQGIAVLMHPTRELEPLAAFRATGDDDAQTVAAGFLDYLRGCDRTWNVDVQTLAWRKGEYLAAVRRRSA